MTEQQRQEQLLLKQQSQEISNDVDQEELFRRTSLFSVEHVLSQGAMASNAIVQSAYYLSGDEFSSNPEWIFDEVTGTPVYVGDSVFEDDVDSDGEDDDEDEDEDGGEFFATYNERRQYSSKMRQKKRKRLMKKKKLEQKEKKRRQRKTEGGTDEEKSKINRSMRGKSRHDPLRQTPVTKKARTHYFENQLGMLVKKKQKFVLSFFFFFLTNN